MSWWTNLRDTYVEVQTAGLYSPRESRHKEAEARYMMNDQMKQYKEQTELTKQELNRARDEKEAEKRRIEEKQIRTLRRNYRTAGILGGSSNSQPDMNDKLGG